MVPAEAWGARTSGTCGAAPNQRSRRSSRIEPEAGSNQPEPEASERSVIQAPPVSVTHYMDRDDQFLAEVSSRRYFCLQCHVVQTDAEPLVANGFRDIDSVLRSERE